MPDRCLLISVQALARRVCKTMPDPTTSNNPYETPDSSKHAQRPERMPMAASKRKAWIGFSCCMAGFGISIILLINGQPGVSALLAMVSVFGFAFVGILASQPDSDPPNRDLENDE